MTEAFNTLFTAMKIIKRNAKVKNIFANRGKWFRSAKGYINNITTRDENKMLWAFRGMKN